LTWNEVGTWPLAIGLFLPSDKKRRRDELRGQQEQLRSGRPPGAAPTGSSRYSGAEEDRGELSHARRVAVDTRCGPPQLDAVGDVEHTIEPQLGLQTSIGPRAEARNRPAAGSCGMSTGPNCYEAADS
jgi:hypothetical protein